jgi:hypothetical protein
MIDILHTTLFAIYSVIFPWLFGEGPATYVHDDSLDNDYSILRSAPHWSFERTGPWFRINLYNPLRPLFWWRQTKFLNEALEVARREAHEAFWVDWDS